VVALANGVFRILVDGVVGKAEWPSFTLGLATDTSIDDLGACVLSASIADECFGRKLLRRSPRAREPGLPSERDNLGLATRTDSSLLLPSSLLLLSSPLSFFGGALTLRAYARAGEEGADVSERGFPRSSLLDVRNKGPRPSISPGLTGPTQELPLVIAEVAASRVALASTASRSQGNITAALLPMLSAAARARAFRRL
jgi:hypothetical protein